MRKSVKRKRKGEIITERKKARKVCKKVHKKWFKQSDNEIRSNFFKRKVMPHFAQSHFVDFFIDKNRFQNNLVPRPLLGIKN